MRKAGDYKYRFQWLQQSTVKSATSGNETEVFTEIKPLWCAFEKPKPSERIYWGGLSSVVDAVVRVRGNVGITARDRLKDPSTNEIYLITGVFTDTQQNEQVLYVAVLREGL